MEYTHHGSTLHFKVPGHTAVRNRVMKMGEDTVEGTRKMFAVRLRLFGTDQEVDTIFQELDSKVSLSLDAWTSSNQHPFLAIVAHYVTNEGKLGEFLM